MRKLIFSFFIVISGLLIFCLKTYAGSAIDNLVDSNPISKTAIISVSIRDASTENVIYSRDEKLLLHPASTLKAFTTAVILDKLGKDYKLNTSFYKSEKKNNIYIRLSGDPFLCSEDLNASLKKIKSKGIKKFSSITIDDSALDNICWGVGWMWDDAASPDIPKYSVYNINHNLIKNKNGIAIPVDNPEEYFISCLKKAVKNNKIKLKSKIKIKSGNIPDNTVFLTNISHDLLSIIKETNENSDNLAAETLFKIAGKNNADSPGATDTAIDKFKCFYEKSGLKTNDLKIVDGSGVSHYNLIQTDWMSLALVKIFKTLNFDIYLNTLATPGRGTLNNRLLPLKGKLWAKTGTLTGVSGLTGYIKTKSDKVYTFAILIQNYTGSSSEAKKLEDQIVNGAINL